MPCTQCDKPTVPVAETGACIFLCDLKTLAEQALACTTCGLVYCGACATKVEGHPRSFDQALGAPNIIGSRRMLKRFDLQTLLLTPLAGTLMEFGQAIPLILWRRGDLLVESLPQQIRKEMVIAIPASLVIQRDDEQVGSLQLFQHCL